MVNLMDSEPNSDTESTQSGSGASHMCSLICLQPLLQFNGIVIMLHAAYGVPLLATLHRVASYACLYVCKQVTL